MGNEIGLRSIEAYLLMFLLISYIDSKLCVCDILSCHLLTVARNGRKMDFIHALSCAVSVFLNNYQYVKTTVITIGNWHCKMRTAELDGEWV